MRIKCAICRSQHLCSVFVSLEWLGTGSIVSIHGHCRCILCQWNMSLLFTYLPRYTATTLCQHVHQIADQQTPPAISPCQIQCFVLHDQCKKWTQQVRFIALQTSPNGPNHWCIYFTIYRKIYWWRIPYEGRIGFHKLHFIDSANSVCFIQQCPQIIFCV